MSLRSKLASAAGAAYARALAARQRVTGQARARSLGRGRGAEERLFRRRGRLGIITDAVEHRQQLRFWYDNTTSDYAGNRLGDPYGVYVRQGQTYLLMWVTPPTASATPQDVPGWRLFILSHVKNPRIQVKMRGGKPVPFRVRRGVRRFREGRFTVRVRA